jgi:hypothetical protein
MHYATNFNQRKFIDGQWPTFTKEPRNVQLGLAIDGVNPFGEKQSTWSTSLVLLTNYNIPPLVDNQEIFHHVIIDHPWTKLCETSNL